MANYQPGDLIRVKPNHPLIKYRGDTGEIRAADKQKYSVVLEENGLVLLDEHNIEDIRAIQWRNQI